MKKIVLFQFDSCEGTSSFTHHCFFTISANVNTLKKTHNFHYLLRKSLTLLASLTQRSTDHTLRTAELEVVTDELDRGL